MFRWEQIEEQEIFDMTVKMYRDPFVADDKFIVPFTSFELDHYAYRYMQSELFMYRIMDTNWDSYMEERGDVKRMKTIYIPTKEDNKDTIL